MPRTPDFAVALTLALLGSTVLLYPHPLTYLRASLLALCAALAAFVLYVSSRPAKWICVTPPESNDKLGSSLRPTRASGSRLPCPYPNAWYCLTLTNELPPGAVLQGNACGKLFVVWRPTELADDGVSWRDAVVMDSFCPHLGANLAAGGIVDNGCLRCPFHGWTFDKSGCVVNVPGADTCPPHASVRTFESRERNGVISVWLGCEDHDRGKAPRVIRDAPSAEEKSSKSLATTKPQYSIPTFPQLNGSSCWVYHGFSEHVVNALLWEIPENGSDVAHLPALHAGFVMPSLSPLFGHAWNATWDAITAAEGAKVAGDASNGSGTASGPQLAHPFARIHITEAITVAGVALPGEVDVTILQAGPTQVFLRMNTPVGPLMIVETVTPVAPLRLRVLHAVYAHPLLPSVVALAVLSATVRQFERDIPVWMNKRYEPKPLLSAADKAIPRYRRWTTQFWGEGAITFEEAMRAHIGRELGMPSDSALDW